MPTTLSYDGKKLVPAPFLNIQKSYYKDAESNIGATFQISVQGTLVAFMGAPSPSGDYIGAGYPSNFPTANDSRLKNVLRQQEILREMFSNDFRLFEIQSADGSAPLRCRPRILDISFDADVWFDKCTYQIQMEAPELSVFGTYHGGTTEDSFNQYLLSAEESWNTEYDEERDVFLLSHSLSAQGRAYYDLDGIYTAPVDSAQRWISSRLGADLSVVNSGLLDLATFQASNLYDYLKTRSVNKSQGSVDLTESWILSVKPYTEEYTVNVDDSDEGKQVTIQGSLQGLSTRTFGTGVIYQTTKWASASGAWSSIRNELYNRALNLSQLSWVNPSPLSYSVGYNQLLGQIQYNYNFNDAPPNLIDGARFERINVSDDNPADIVAILPVLGRRAGPIIQPINTVSERRRTLTIEVALTGAPITTQAAKIAYLADWNTVRPNWGAITGVMRPLTTRYIEQDQETCDMNTRRYSKVVTWVY